MSDLFAFVVTYKMSNTKAVYALSKHDPLRPVNNGYHFFFLIMVLAIACMVARPVWN